MEEVEQTRVQAALKSLNSHLPYEARTSFDSAMFHEKNMKFVAEKFNKSKLMHDLELFEPPINSSKVQEVGV